MLYIDLENKDIVFDETNNTRYWCQYDFAYKARTHVYDNENNEIGYIQFKVLSIQKGISFFDKDDNPIQMDDIVIINQEDKNNFVLKYCESIVTVTKNDDRLNIDYSENIDLNKCILFIVSLLNKE